MALIAPLRGLRYNPAKISSMEEVVSPPYDVIDAKAHAELFQKNPYNMIQLDLSKTLTPGAAGDERYEQANRTFRQWQDDNILIRDQVPSLYLYYIDYTHPSGRRLTRKGLVGRIKLAEFSEGIVKPHEKTFRQVTTDRLRLLDACQAQFSKIFSLYPDTRGEVIDSLEAARVDEPLCSVVDHDGCRHTLWAVIDPPTIAAVYRMFQDKPVYIADGHHRYTTALQFRELMRKRLGGLAEDSPYNFTMMYLCGMEDPGLSVLPTHRLVRVPGGNPAQALADKLAAAFLVEEVRGGSREVLLSEVLARMDENALGATMFGFYHPEEDRCFLLTLKEGALAGTPVERQPQALQQLDVVVLSDLVLDHLLGLGHERCEEENLIDYFSDPDEAIDVAVKLIEEAAGMTPVIFLMNPTRVSQVKQVADQDLVMPHKSTFFYPKILTGLLINKLDGEEKVGTCVR